VVFAGYDGGMANRYFALVPAAGQSSRMGRPKLLLPLMGRPLVAHTIGAWLQAGVDRVVVVVRPGDEPLRTVIAEMETDGRVDLVIPEIAPPEMKDSLKTALVHVERKYGGTDNDAFLVAPADMPHLSAQIISRLIRRHTERCSREILLPTLAGVRGHPVLFPWRYGAEVFQLADHEGLNVLVERSPVAVVPCDDLVMADHNPFGDIDTQDEYDQVANGRTN